jgi:hypothetical protein
MEYHVERLEQLLAIQQSRSLRVDL